MIALHGVGKRFGSAVALHPTDLEFQPRRTTALIGPSGSGKSTILRLIAGLLTPTTGVVSFAGEVLNAANVVSLRRRMGYVIQEGGLFPHLTAAGNVLLMARHLGRPADEATARVDWLCALTAFPREALHRYPFELSGGQRQRVSLMRALLLDPDVLLLDEPLAALDVMVRGALQEELKAIVERVGRTAILVTHDLAEAAFLADHLVLLDQGRIVQQGSLADLRERPASPFVPAFLSAQRRLEER